MPLDEWQEQVLEAAMGERADGQWSSKFVGMSVPRQNGKSQMIVARALAGILLFGEKVIIISAHETDTAREIWKRLLDVVEANPTLEARVTGRMDAINREYLSFGAGMDRQEIKLKARRANGSRGFSADCLLLDEAQMLGKRSWGSIVPTMSARPNPQLWLFGTPPTEDDDSFAFSRVRESSSAKKARHCWLEWGAEAGDDLDDPAVWAKANPSYGVRLTHEAIADDRAAMDDSQFMQERLGMWDLRAASEVFGPGAWAGARRDAPPAAALRMRGLALAASFDLAYVSLVAAGVDDEGIVHIKPLWHGPQSQWEAARAKRLQVQHKVEVVVDPKGPAADMLSGLEAEGVRLLRVTLDNVLDSCSLLYKRVQAQTAAHAAYEELDAAVSVAVKRPVRDRWAWGRRQSSDDISSLEAATLAVWQASATKKPARSAYESNDLLVV